MKQIYNITDYGAVAGSKELQTAKIQAAIDAAFLAGGGEVVVPAGVFKSATIKMRSNITLRLLSGAVIDGSTDPDDYTHFLEDTLEPIDLEKEVDPDFGTLLLTRPWYNGLIKAYKAKNIKILGEKDSIICGNNVFNPEGEENYRGPHAVMFTLCENIELAGYTVKDSGNFAHNLHICKNIYAHDLTVLAGHDGIHFKYTKNILIENCEFYTGDDCVAAIAAENVVVRNCLLDCACSAFRLGGTDILIDSCCTHAPSRYGFRGSLSPEEKAASAPTNETHRHTQHTPFLYFCCGTRKIEKPQGNVIIQNCTFERPNSLFRLRWGKDKWVTNRSLVDVTIKNCKCHGVSLPIDLYCDENEPCSLRLEDVEISPREGCEDAIFMNAQHFKQIYFENVTVTGFNDPTIFTTTEGEIIMKNSSPIKVQKTDKLIDRYV